jgi:hypothetical protein
MFQGGGGGIGDDEESKRKTNKDGVYRTSMPRRKKNLQNVGMKKNVSKNETMACRLVLPRIEARW